jgi:hypothetical protein
MNGWSAIGKLSFGLRVIKCRSRGCICGGDINSAFPPEMKERNAEQNDCKADRRPNRTQQEQVEANRERGESENEWGPRIAPNSIGAG